MDVAYSVNGVPIRLTRERWFHIVENHDELAGRYDDVLSAIEDPDLVLPGYGGALIAVRGVGRQQYLAVVYKELGSEDGFVLSAYLTRKVIRRKAIWKKSS